MVAINKNHLKIGRYTIQHDWIERFVVLDEEGQQYGTGYDHVCDAIEQVLMYND